MSTKRFLLAVFLVVGVSHLAHATTTAELLLKSGATTVVITDNGAGDLNPADGSILYTNPNLDGWKVSFASGDSTSPGVTPFAIDIGSFTATCDGTGCATDDLLIGFSDINFTAPIGPGGFTTTFSATIASGSASQQAWDDTTNTIFGAGTSIGVVGPFFAPNGAGSASGGGPAGPSPYSLTITDRITHGSSGVSLDGNITAVPEPSSLLLLGTGLLGLATFAKKKFHRG